jgi:hypothetical protein
MRSLKSNIAAAFGSFLDALAGWTLVVAGPQPQGGIVDDSCMCGGPLFWTALPADAANGPQD